jgi:uncharacterized Tic20 family protein
VSSTGADGNDQPTVGRPPQGANPGGEAPQPPPGYPVPPAPAAGYPPPSAPQYGAAPGGYPPPAYGAGAPLSDADQRLWAVLSHIGGVFVSFLVPLIVWLVFRARGAFVEDQAKEALNFQITVVIAYLVGGVLSIIGIGLLILLATWALTIIFAILAAVKSSSGERYRYPVNIRFIH